MRRPRGPGESSCHAGHKSAEYCDVVSHPATGYIRSPSGHRAPEKDGW